MGTGSKYKTKKVVRVLESLANKSGKFRLDYATKEGRKIVREGVRERPFSVPTNHRYINTYIVEDIGERLELFGACTKKEFLELVK